MSEKIKEIKTICVYCSTFNKDNKFNQEIEALAKLISKNKIATVYGGGNTGIMGKFARKFIDNGGEVTAVIPEFLHSKITLFDDISKVIITKTMQERKKKMFELSDAFIALPGGIGTLDELVEIMTWSQLKIHDKVIIIANFDGFWNPFIKLLEHLESQTFIRDLKAINYKVASSPEEIIELIK
ncbi:TIGR00730 family Rossman fold protein [Hyphomicrobiales bacterium]|nr:TIGR00730 family Rossman fold protein [Hyphomicrobiales bacterium]